MSSKSGICLGEALLETTSINKFVASGISFGNDGFRRICEVFCKNEVIKYLSLGLTDNTNLSVLIELIKRGKNLENLTFECCEKGGWDKLLLKKFIEEFKQNTNILSVNIVIPDLVELK
jgi:hypothetical protein